VSPPLVVLVARSHPKHVEWHRNLLFESQRDWK
jgi:hypothetical protein